MVEDPDNLILVYLRRIDGKVDQLTADVQDLKERVSGVELGLAHVRRDFAQLSEFAARLQARVDKMDDRLSRIERRLDISDTH